MVIYNSSVLSVSNIINTGEEEEVHLDIHEEISAIDIASALVMLKKQHRLSTKCIGDIIRLLRTFRVRNTPSSWYNVKTLLSESKPTSINHFICPTCSQTTTSEQKCTSCSTIHHSRLLSFRSFSVAEQIQSILSNNQDADLLYDAKSTALCDIRDGAIFRSLRKKNSDRVLTLTLNIDGVQPSRNSQSSIWPVLLVVNELPPERRFALENIILGGVWCAKTKPSRENVRLLLRPLIDELLELEKGYYFVFSGGIYYLVNVYLIGACCDKPAQALAQCISEPIAAFGCGRCEVEGK